MLDLNWRTYVTESLEDYGLNDVVAEQRLEEIFLPAQGELVDRRRVRNDNHAPKTESRLARSWASSESAFGR